MAYYGIQESNLPSSEGKRTVFPRIKLSGQTNLDEIAENISHESTFTPAEIKGIVQSLAKTIAKSMARGNSVKIEGLGIFTPAIGLREDAEQNSKGEQRYNPTSLCINSVRFKADKALVAETDSMCELERSQEKFKQSSQKHTKDERLAMALAYLSENQFMTIDDYCALTGLLRYTASLELKNFAADSSTGITTSGRSTHKVYVKK